MSRSESYDCFSVKWRGQKGSAGEAVGCEWDGWDGRDDDMGSRWACFLGDAVVAAAAGGRRFFECKSLWLR